MIDGKNFFDQPVKNDKVTYENIRKVAAGQGDDYTAGCLFRLYLFQKLLQNGCTRFKEATSARCWSISNSTN